MKFETTLFIPTHNRPNQLKRLLNFLSGPVEVIQVIVADSSDSFLFAENQRNIDESCRGGLRLLHLDCRGKSLLEKYLCGIDLVETDSMCFCGDDDLIVAEQVVRGAKFLHESPDFSHVRGAIVTFLDSSDVGLKQSIREYPQYQIDMDSPFDRLAYHLKHYKSNFYSVRRTLNVRDNFRAIFKMDLGRGLYERLIPILDLLDGKGAVFPELFMARQKGQSLRDEQGNNTTGDRKLHGKEYALELTRNSSIYLEFIEKALQKKAGGADREVAELMLAFERDLERYFRDKERPNRITPGRVLGMLTRRIHRRDPFPPTENNRKALERITSHVVACRTQG